MYTVRLKNRYFIGFNEIRRPIFLDNTQMWSQKKKPVIFTTRKVALEAAILVNDRLPTTKKIKCTASQVMWTNTNIKID